MLVVAMAVPTSASTVAMGRQWGSFTYGTSDTCNSVDFRCVIESGDSEYTLKTDVSVTYFQFGTGTVSRSYGGNPQRLISTTSGNVGMEIRYIYCYHYLDNNCASTQRVEPGP